MTENEKNEAQRLFEAKVNNEKIDAMGKSINEILKIFPEYLIDLRNAVEYLEKQNSKDFYKLEDTISKFASFLNGFKRDFEILLNEIKKLDLKDEESLRLLRNILDKSDENITNKIVLIKQELSSQLVDLNNEKSIQSIIEKRFSEQSNRLFDKNDDKSLVSIINKENEKILNKLGYKDFISWAILTLGAIVSILASLGIIGK